MGAREVACLDCEVRGFHRSTHAPRSAVCLTFSGCARDALGNTEPECTPHKETHTGPRARYTHMLYKGVSIATVKIGHRQESQHGFPAISRISKGPLV